MDAKLRLIHDLSDCGMKVVEAGSFVSPKWVPQMADTASLFTKISQRPGIFYPCLVPNVKGMEAAIKCGVDEIAISTAVSESAD